MSPFDALAGAALSTIQSVYGSSTVFTYSRPAGPRTDAVASFAITASMNAGGDYTTPTGPIDCALLVNISDIPLGPIKGDLVAISLGRTGFRDGTYLVQEIFIDAAIGWANLALRFKQ